MHVFVFIVALASPLVALVPICNGVTYPTKQECLSALPAEAARIEGGLDPKVYAVSKVECLTVDEMNSEVFSSWARVQRR